MVRDRVPKDGAKLFNGESVNRAHTVYQGLEVPHLGDTIKNYGQLISRDSTIIKEHTVDNLVVKELACFSQALTVTIA